MICPFFPWNCQDLFHRAKLQVTPISQTQWCPRTSASSASNYGCYGSLYCFLKGFCYVSKSPALSSANFSHGFLVLSFTSRVHLTYVKLLAFCCRRALGFEFIDHRQIFGSSFFDDPCVFITHLHIIPSFTSSQSSHH